ncbi:MAG: NADPH:quinone oxidoreductase family protein [Proteobacteria bacterium]|nr:NADPH:quinone oxidoreductase family protein [Pseudomonadota bacterium]
MRALICRQWGGLDQLEIASVAAPTPSESQILISCEATAVNYADAIMVSGKYQTKPPLPFSPGLETAGTVLACGSQVTRFSPGDRVMSLLHFGGLAEQAVAEESDSWKIPETMDIVDAGAFPIAYLSSDVALRWQGRLERNETLIVLGAAGGVGLTAVEIGKAMGATVIACASTPEKLAIAREHGADALINYSNEDLKARVLELTDERGADVCFDPIGGQLFDASLSSLGWGGRYVHVGFVGGVPNIPANRLLVKNRAALGSSLRYFRWYAQDKLQTSMESLLQWYMESKLSPLVTHQFPLDRSVEGIKLLTERRAYGRILILPRTSS